VSEAAPASEKQCPHSSGLVGSKKGARRPPLYRFVLLFGITALGLFAFGAFQFVVAYYRSIDAPNPEEIGREVRSRGKAVAQVLTR
jgi:hypothetical protein